MRRRMADDLASSPARLPGPLRRSAGCRCQARGARRCEACPAIHARIGGSSRHPPSCPRLRQGLPASVSAPRAFKSAAKGALVQDFILKLDRSKLSKSGSTIMRRYCTGTSIACVARWRFGEAEGIGAPRTSPSERACRHGRALGRRRRASCSNKAASRRASRRRGRRGRSRPLQLRPAHPMRLDDALGRACRARGIDDVERRIGQDAHGRGLGPRGASQG